MAGFGNNGTSEVMLETQAVTTDDSGKSSVVEFSEEIIFPDMLLRDALQQSGIGGEHINGLKKFLDIEGISGFTRYGILNNHIILPNNTSPDYIIGYSQETQTFFLDERTVPELLADQNETAQEQVEEISRKERLLSSVMYAIEHIFRENDKEWFQRLNEHDTFYMNSTEYPWSEIPEFSGKTELQIQNLQKVARRLLAEIQDMSSGMEDSITQELREKIAEHEEKYLDYIVGIGDMYEGGANAFHSNENGEHNVTEEEIESTVERIVERKSVEDCFRYMVEKHAEIEANNYQSTEVMRTYGAWKTAINRAVLNKMKQENSEDKVFLQYAKIVSGRDVPEYSTLISTVNMGRGQTQEIRSTHSLDSDLFDPDSASQALLYVFEREGGILSQIGEQIKIEDPLMENMSEEEKKPASILNSCIGMLEEKVEGVKETGGIGLLAATGFGNIITLSENTKYEDLSISEKMQVSILLRLTRRLNIIGGTTSTPSGQVIENPNMISIDSLSSIFLDIAEIGQDAIITSINDNFDGSWGFLQIGNSESGDFGLEGYQAQIFDLYQDIWGNGGLFDLSDNNVEWLRFGAQFGAIIIGSIALGMAALPVLTAAGVLSAAAAGTNAAMITSSALASVAVSRVVMPEGYDSNQDMLLDVGTDCIVAVLFGLIGGKVTSMTHGPFVESGGTLTRGWLSTSEGRKHLGANMIDLSIFGIASELGRNIAIRPYIDNPNRFSYREFHEYVAPEIRKYFTEQLDGENTGQE